jgi:hypothetical protein
MTPSTSRRLLTLVPLALSLLAGAALWPSGTASAATAGSGRAATEARAVAPFEAIAVQGEIELVVRQSDAPSLAVTADDNLLPLLETVVEGGTLKLRFRAGERVRPKTAPKVVVEATRLKAVSAAGSGNLRLDGLRAPAFALSIAGSSDAVLHGLQVDALQVSVAGSGDVHGDGSARTLKVSIAGSGDVDLTALQADEVRVSIAGSGDAAVTANRTLQASVAGSGDVRYRGNVATVTTSVVGSGRVSRR